MNQVFGLKAVPNENQGFPSQSSQTEIHVQTVWTKYCFKHLILLTQAVLVDYSFFFIQFLLSLPSFTESGSQYFCLVVFLYLDFKEDMKH